MSMYMYDTRNPLANWKVSEVKMSSISNYDFEIF